MRICLVSEYYYPLLGGITEHVHQFSRHCIERGHDVTLLTSHAGPVDEHLVPRGLKIHRTGRSLPLLSNDSFARVSLGPRIGTDVRNLLDRGNFDVVHIHAAMTPVLPLLAIRYKNAPTVGTIHSYFEGSRYYEMLRAPCQNLLDRHDRIIAVSSSCIDAMKRYFTFDATIIPNGVDTGYFSKGKKLPGSEKNPFTIFFLGRLDPRNGIDTLIRAFAILRERNVPARLVIAGKGPFIKHYQGMVPGEIRGDVEFAGAILKERPDYFASSDVFCYPATKASFGITILEAMAAGVPVIASHINGFQDLVRHEQDGLLVPAGDPEAFADAFERLAADRNLRTRMGEEGRKRAEEFSWGRVTDTILSFYKETLGA